LGAAICWSFIGVAYELILAAYTVDPVTILALRATTAAVALLGFLAIQRRAGELRPLFAPRLAPSTLSIGLISTTGFYISLIYAFQLAGVAVGTVLLYLAPSLVALGTWIFFKTRLVPRQAMALAVALTGVVGISGLLSDAGSVHLGGLLLGLASAAGYASYSLFGHHLLQRVKGVVVVAASLGIGALGLWAVKLTVFGPQLPEPWAIFWIVTITGFGTTLTPMLLYTYGLSRVGPARAILIATLEPVLAVVWAFLILGEALSAPQLVGGALVIMSIAIANGGRAREVPV
jgi:drug/metabolite transporter (DMT)-like permease